MSSPERPGAAAGLVLLALALSACGPNMRHQPRLNPYEESSFFADGKAARELVPGTVIRGRLEEDEHLHRGLVDGREAETLPLALSRELLERGQERYQIFCSPCHGELGYGDGIIVQRGFGAPPSLHTTRLRASPLGHFFVVITEGWGTMFSYADRVPVEDRWAIAAFIRVLQLSQSFPLGEVPPEDLPQLQGQE